nr:MAG TPA: hypothetical protein [Caudoviricetes sp.]
MIFRKSKPKIDATFEEQWREKREDVLWWKGLTPAERRQAEGLNRREKPVVNKEETRQKYAQQAQYQKVIRNKITKVVLVSTSSRKKAGSVAGRMLVGSAFGTIGAVAGGMSAKNRETATFYVTYQDGHTKTETVDVGSARFRELMGYVV